MDDRVREALASDRTIDITTTGRRSGEGRRKEIWFHNLDGAVYITGTPGRRDWYANLLAHPNFTFHLKGSVVTDLPARATPVTDPVARRTVLSRILQTLGRSEDIETWMTRSPLLLSASTCDAAASAFPVNETEAFHAHVMLARASLNQELRYLCALNSAARLSGGKPGSRSRQAWSRTLRISVSSAICSPVAALRFRRGS
jgi:hypothetical protein